MFAYKFLLCTVVVAVSIGNVRSALSKEDMERMKEAFAPALEACSQKHSIEKDDFAEAKENGDLSGIDSCFFSCMLTEGEMLEDGKFNSEKAIEKIKEYISNEDDANRMAEIVTECTEEIGDDFGEGDESCKKAQLMFSCLMKHKFHMD